MKNFSQFDAAQARRVKYVLCDIDDTITTGGKLTARAYAALWEMCIRDRYRLGGDQILSHYRCPKRGEVSTGG